MQNFTEDELVIAKSVDLVAVASSLGYTPKRIGNYYTLEEMDSMRIYNRSHWCRFSRRYEKGENGGSQIDFLRVFAGMDVKEAVFWLLDFAGYRRIHDTPEKPILKYQVPYKKVEKKPFVLPQPAHSNAYLYEYLTNDRAISRDVVNFYVNQGLIYESMPYHNIVFKGNDKEGVTYGFTAFFFKNLWGSNMLKNCIISFMSGSIIPFDFLPYSVEKVLNVLPFASLNYVPVLIYMGRYSKREVFIKLGIQIFWIFLFWGLSKIMWKIAFKHLVVQGG